MTGLRLYAPALVLLFWALVFTITSGWLLLAGCLGSCVLALHVHIKESQRRGRNRGSRGRSV